MNHYLVEWRNHENEYRSLIVYAKGFAQACRLVQQAYPHYRKKPIAQLLDG